MGTITATCGHVLTEAEGVGKAIAIGDYNRECERVVCHMTVCNKCFDWYQRKRLILTEKEQERYLNGK